MHHWHDSDSSDAYCLQIELGNDHAITLTVSQKHPPSVDILHGNGEHSFADETLDSFREFVAAAFEILTEEVEPEYLDTSGPGGAGLPLCVNGLSLGLPLSVLAIGSPLAFGYDKA